MKRAVICCLAGVLLSLAQADGRPASGWVSLEGCRLLSGAYHDGDSFHVLADGKDRVFRLYAVDAAETGVEFPERVQEQGDYFRAGEEEVLAAGAQARELARRLLRQPFTVQTRWNDAKGSGRQARFFAQVTLADGSDLGLQLVGAGLARSYGMREGLPGAYLAALDRAELSAKRARLGLWGGKEKVSPPETVIGRGSGEDGAAEDDLLGTGPVFRLLQEESSGAAAP